MIRPHPEPGLVHWPAVSAIMPVLNEARHLASAVEHVLKQDYPGEIELVMALGPSTDDTDRIAAALSEADPRVRTVPNPTGRTPAALNAAIAAARHDVIVRVDGHGCLPQDYLRIAVELLEKTGADNVGGLMKAEGTTLFECAVACAMTSPLGVGNARFHTGGEAGPADTVYLGVFRRAILTKLGGYDESFQRAQDWELNYRIRSAGGLIWFSPQLWVSYRPRPDLKAVARQYFHYGRWRRIVMRQHPGTVNLRYLAPPTALVGVVAGTLAGLLVHPLGFVLPLGYLAGVLAGSAWVGRRLPPRALAALPAIIATMHFSWAVGFLTSPRRLVPAQPSRPASGVARG
jgi:succinoglycan biosynthesis protein ExoA